MDIQEEKITIQEWTAMLKTLSEPSESEEITIINTNKCETRDERTFRGE